MILLDNVWSNVSQRIWDPVQYQTLDQTTNGLVKSTWEKSGWILYNDLLLPSRELFRAVDHAENQ